MPGNSYFNMFYFKVLKCWSEVLIKWVRFIKCSWSHCVRDSRRVCEEHWQDNLRRPTQEGKGLLSGFKGFVATLLGRLSVILVGIFLPYTLLKLAGQSQVWNAHFHPSTWEAEADESLWVWGQPCVQSEFQDSHSYIEKPCLGTKKKKKSLTNIKSRTFLRPLKKSNPLYSEYLKFIRTIFQTQTFSEVYFLFKHWIPRKYEIPWKFSS